MIQDKFRRFATRRPYIPVTSLPVPPVQSASGIRPGVFCDCLGTLYSHTHGRNKLLVRYLNEKFSRGHEVTILSSTPFECAQIVADIGLKEEIVKTLSAKNRFFGQELELLIDDNPPEELKARILRHPHDPEFIAVMQKYMRDCRAEHKPLPPA